jgi:hypothetical protein
MPSIIPEPDQIQDVAKRLLKAAGDRSSEIRTDTSGSGLAFVVPDDIAEKAGFGSGYEEVEPSEPAGTDEEIIDEPPRSGDGSGRDAWREFLTAKGVEWNATASRDALVELWDSQGSSAGE